MEGPARHSQGSARVVSGFLFLKHVANIRPHFTTQEGLANSPFSVVCGNEEGDRGSRWPTRGLDAHAGMESSSLGARPQAGSGFCCTSAPKKLASPHHTVATLWSHWGQRWMVSALSLPCSLAGGHAHGEDSSLQGWAPQEEGTQGSLAEEAVLPFLQGGTWLGPGPPPTLTTERRTHHQALPASRLPSTHTGGLGSIIL